MKQFLLIFSLLCLITSCSTEDICEDQFGNSIDCNYVSNNDNPDNGNNDGNNNGSYFAESEFMIQTGSVIYDLNANTISVPFRTKGIPLDAYRVDINIIQNGIQLAPGIFILEKDSQSFYSGTYQIAEGTPLATNGNIVIQMYVAITSTNRELKDSISLN